MARTTLLVLALLALVSVVLAESRGMSKSFSDQDKTFFRKQLSAVRGEPTPREIFSTTRGLKYLGAEVAKKSDFCKQASAITTSFASASDLEDFYYAFHAQNTLNCPGFKPSLSSAVSQRIDSVIENSRDVSEIFFAVQLATYVPSGSKQTLKQVESDELSQVIHTLLELRDEDGTFLNHEGAEAGSILAAGRAFQVISSIVANVALSEDDQLSLEMLADSIEDILSLGEASGSGIAFFDEGDSRSAFQVTEALFTGLIKLREFIEFEIADGLISGVAEGIVSRPAPPTSVNDVSDLLAVVNLMTGTHLPNPIAFFLQSNTVSDKDGDIVASVTDIWGKPLSVQSVHVVRAHSAKTGVAAVSNQKLTKASDGVYKYNFKSVNPEGGIFFFEFSVAAGGKYESITSAQRVIKSMVSIAVTSVTLELVDLLDQDVSSSQIIPSGSKIDLGTEWDYYHTMKLSFDVTTKEARPVSLQQVAVRISNAQSGNEVVVGASGSRGHYSVDLSLESIGKELGFTQGDHAVSIIAADSFVENPLVISLGALNLNFPASIAANFQDSASLNSFKKEISHVFRQPEPRPPVTLSTAFTGVVLAPAGVVFLGLVRVGGLNLSNMPFSGFAFIASIGFIVSIGLSGFCLWLYWVGLNMFQTAYMLAPLAVAAIFFGKFALRYRQSLRAKKKAD